MAPDDSPVTQHEFSAHQRHKYAHPEERHDQEEGWTRRLLAMDNRIDKIEARISKNDRWRWYLSGGLAVVAALVLFVLAQLAAGRPL